MKKLQRKVTLWHEIGVRFIDPGDHEIITSVWSRLDRETWESLGDILRVELKMRVIDQVRKQAFKGVGK